MRPAQRSKPRSAALQLVTSAGPRLIPVLPTETVYDALWRLKIPSACTMVVERIGVSERPVSLLSLFSGLSGRVVVYLNRNIKLPGIDVQGVKLVKRQGFATECMVPPTKAGDDSRGELVQLRSDDVVDLATFATNRVMRDVLRSTSKASPIVVGYSGGGDSNLLLTALRQAPVLNKSVLMPTMVLGIPDWDRQLPIAREHCSSMGLALRVVEPSDSGIGDFKEALRQFKKEFPSSGREFFGTWYLRQALTKVAREVGSRAVCLGMNREDILAEALFLLANGRAALPFPVRKIGRLRVVTPLYELPKRVIDGAFPSYSQRNYRNRDASQDLGRSAFYYLAAAIQDLLPGMDLSLLRGLGATASGEQIVWDPQLADHVLADAPAGIRRKWRKVLGDRRRRQS